jgi:hypothetical protein
MLGADEFGFATAPLVVEGCIMMRKCHLNTCPVGVATQDPVLRRKFQGKPEHVVNFFFFIAEEARELMAQLGVRTVDELIGRADLLDMKKGIEHWKAKGLDFSRVFYQPKEGPEVARRRVEDQDHGLDKALDHRLIELARPALERGERVTIETPIRNINRTVGTMLAGAVAKRYGHEGLPDDTIRMSAMGLSTIFSAFSKAAPTMRAVGTRVPAAVGLCSAPRRGQRAWHSERSRIAPMTKAQPRVSKWTSSECVSMKQGDTAIATAPMPASGSSSSSTSGSTTMARASATRCCWPPDSSAG